MSTFVQQFADPIQNMAKESSKADSLKINKQKTVNYMWDECLGSRVSDLRSLNEIREDMELIKKGKAFLLHEEETRRNYI